MRKNWISIVSLALNVVLLVSVISLGGKLERTEENLRGWIGRIESEVQESTGTVVRGVERVLEDSVKQVMDYEIQPLYIDSENQTLEADVVLRLREWSEDTTVEVKAAAGRNTFITLLPITGDGICTGQMAFPLNEQGEVKLSATVTRGGVSVREELGGWWDIAAMLPVQLSSWGGSTPRYEDGAVRLGDFDVSLFDGQDQYGIQVQEPEFRLYVNEALAAAGSAVEVEDDSPQHFVQYEYVLEPVACQPGDTIRLNFVCKDDFGLGYEFVLGHWRVPAEEDVLEEVPVEAGTRPILTWE